MKKKLKVNKKLVSIIIPAYIQEETIIKDLLRIEQVLYELRYEFEIIVVVDGMQDKTFEKAKKIKSKNIKVYGYETNKGKGYAIRYGMIKAKGDIIGFVDAGMDINPNGISMLLENFEWYRADVIVGSKRHHASKVNYPIDRRIISFLSQIFIKILFGLNVRDTQVGLKFFRRKVIVDVLPRLIVKKFAFDIEILVVAHYLGYKRIFEAPVDLTLNFSGSIVSRDLFKILLDTLWDTLAIFYRLKIKKYYDDGSKRKWKFDPEINLKVNIG
jgi:glycosyltransferase involved in cell wall biosynthesis